MASNININNIDATFPIAGVSNDSQGFRNNFSNIRDNLSFAKRELEDLQNKGIFKSALTGTTLVNNMNGAPFSGAEIYDLRETERNAGIMSGTYILDHSLAHFHSMITGGSVTIGFSNLPAAGTVGRFRLKVQITSINHRITLPSSVTQGVLGILGYDDFSRSITFTRASVYLFEFVTADNGTNFNIQDITRGSTLSAPTYILPIASGSILGGVKVGSVPGYPGLQVSGAGVLTYTLPVASTAVLGGVKLSSNTALNGIQMSNDNVISLSVATHNAIGGVRIGAGLSIDPVTGVLSTDAASSAFFTYPLATTSPAITTYQDVGVSGFTAFTSTDFPGQSFSGLTVVGDNQASTKKIGAQIAMGWNTLDASGNPIVLSAKADTGAPKLMYFRTKDDYTGQTTWSPWTRIITEHDLSTGGGGSELNATIVGSGGIVFPSNPGGGTGDAAWIKYFAYSGEKTNLEIGVSNETFGSTEDSINLVSPSGVGINKQTPRATFDVNGTGIFKQLPVNNGGALVLEGSTDDTTDPYLQFVSNGNVEQLGYIQAGMNGVVYVNSAGQLNITVGNTTDAFNIDSYGFVGIPAIPVETAGTTSRLAVEGIIESTLGGIKFPDGSVQASAAAEAGTAVPTWTASGDGVGTGFQLSANTGTGFYIDGTTSQISFDEYSSLSWDGTSIMQCNINFSGSSRVLWTGTATDFTFGANITPKSKQANFTTTSDLRTKTDVKNYELGLDAIGQLRPVTFKYNGLGGSENSDTTRVGLIAQEVETTSFSNIVSEFTATSGEDKGTVYKEVNPSDIIFALINAVNELKARVVELESKV